MGGIVRNSSGTILGTWKWASMGLWAGGFVTGISISTDGQTRVVKQDVGISYVWGPNDTKFRQLFTAGPGGSIPTHDQPQDTSFLTNSGSPGNRTFACAVAPSDHNRIYADFQGRLYKSTDCGLNFTRILNFAGGMQDGIVMQTNSGQQPHNSGTIIAVDPNNADVFAFPTQGNGVFVSTDGGATCTNVNVGANGTNTWQWPHKVAVDPTSTQVSSIRQRWFIMRQGAGVYQSTTGPAGTYTLMTGGPTGYVWNLTFDATGKCWACEYGGSLWRWDSTNGWVDMSDTARGAGNYAQKSNVTVAVSTDGLKVYVTTSDGGLQWSVDGGSTWAASITGGSNFKRNMYTTTAPWLGLGDNNMFKPGMFAINPANGDLWSTAGIGVYKCAPPTSLTPGAGNYFNWYEVSEGIEGLVTNFAVAIPGGNIVGCCWDRPVWRLNPGGIPDGPFVPGGTKRTVTNGYAVDYAEDNKNYIALLADSAGYFCGLSQDGGYSYNPFPTKPPLVNLGGNIAVGTAGNIVIFPSNDSQPIYTTDGGTTWTVCGIPGLAPSGSSNGFLHNASQNRQILRRDKLAGKFYAYNYGVGGTAAGFYSSTDGATWALVGSGGHVATLDNAASRFEWVPTQQGHFFFGCGQGGGPLMWTTDGCVTWTSVANVNAVQAIGFGKAAPGKPYPAIYMCGNYNGVYGVYACFDFNPSTGSGTWVLVTTYPNGVLSFIYWVTGNMDKFGQIIVGHASAGFQYAEYDYELVTTPS